MRAVAVVPALDEAAAVGRVVQELLRYVARVIVVDNGSRDGTGEVARAAGAQVVREERRGYGSACLAGIAALPADTDVVLFADADGSDALELVPRLLEPLHAGVADLVVGARTSRLAERGALTPQQRIGNALATSWLRWRFGLQATDLGPLRAIRLATLRAFVMHDTSYGWTVEMQIKAARAGARYREVPVPYRRRVGRSKISGTLRGTVGAAVKILGLLAYHDLGRALRP